MAKFKTSTSFNKIAQLSKPIRVIQGGKGCSKTISILQLFIFYAISKRQNLVMSIVAKTLPNLKSGALRDFEALLRDMNLTDKFERNKQDKTYTYRTNVIEFFSVDDDSSRLGSRRTHLYINECDKIKQDVFVELQGRTSGFTIVDFNPRKKFYLHTDYIGEDNVEFLKLNYEDNEYIPEQELQSLMFYKKKAEETGSAYWVNKWRVLGLGELGVAEGVIFEEGRDWNITPIPPEARYLGAGLDFGFTHVTAIVKIYVWIDNDGEQQVGLRLALFEAGYTATRIANFIQNDDELMGGIIVCDSARPEMIQEMKAHGCPTISHKKGEVMVGIDLMHSLNLNIDPDSESMIDEFRSYSYAQDRQGNSLGFPNKSADDDNSIDAARYGIERFLAKRRNSRSTLRWSI